MKKLLKVENLKTYFKTRKGIVKAVDGISFELEKGEVLGIAGETGSGKSVAVKSIMRILPSNSAFTEADCLELEGQDLLKISQNDLKNIWGKKISIIFQNPFSYINPLFSIGKQMTDVISFHERVNKKAALRTAAEMLHLVGMPDPKSILKYYPHELSGGMIQRVMIAMSLSCKPALLIADEPTTALDVTVQAQILKLLNDLRDKTSGIILITHNLAIILEVCNSIAIMYAGKLLEKGLVEDVINKPLHPYTQGLLRAIPNIDNQPGRLKFIPGNIPSALNLPGGCRFSPRCPIALPCCTSKEPVLTEISFRHFVACHRFTRI